MRSYEINDHMDTYEEPLQLNEGIAYGAEETLKTVGRFKNIESALNEPEVSLYSLQVGWSNVMC